MDGLPSDNGAFGLFKPLLGQLLETFHWMFVFFWTGYFVSRKCGAVRSWMSCSWLNRLRLRAVTITNFRWIVTDSFDEPKVNHKGDLKSVTWRHKEALGHLLKHHRSRFAKLKLTSEMSDTSFFDVFYGQFTIAVAHKLCCTHQFLRISER